MNIFVKGFLIFAAGMLSYHFLFSSKPKTEAVVRSEPQIEISEPRTRTPSATTQGSNVQVKTAEPIRVEKRTVASIPDTQKPKENLTLTLSEEILSQMEYDWNDLPAQAEAQREDRGWRLTRVNDDSSFHRAGFREGDLITSNFMNSLRNSDARLVTRMEQILNRISR